VPVLVEALDRALVGVRWEVIFVDDDSRDGTAEAVKAIAKHDPRVRCLKRIGRRGLASAGVEGFLASAATYVALMDADMQHDETLLPKMLARLSSGDVDLVAGSRYVEGGSAGGLADANRAWLSQVGGWLAKRVLRIDMTDPMSGFFMIRRATFDEVAPRLSSGGFKLLADIVASSPTPLRVAEVPFTFRRRHAGESKLDTAVKLEYLNFLAEKTIGRIVPIRFLLFSAVGTLGVGVHLVALALYHFGFGASFALAQGAAAGTAMTANFLLNNVLTYRDRRLRGRAVLWGLLSFYAVCSVGLVANVGVADALFAEQREWWVAGLLGALVGAVWNYAASSVLTWRTHR
jgi:dolichol-phosphate mannosyltransferase